MIDHIGYAVKDFDRSKAFYTKALAHLAITPLVEVTAEQTGNDSHVGFGIDRKPFFWIGDGALPASPVHVAFVAKTRAAVEAFYQACIEGGGTDNGSPGLRPQYHPNYYAAFVLDPDGNNIEAVCHN
jgi:catechol 2,3-dioxygenase-like lactoylglutathione lyase family enzyme